MKTIRVEVDLNQPSTLPKGRVNRRFLDATTEDDLLLQQKLDDADSMQDAAQRNLTMKTFKEDVPITQSDIDAGKLILRKRVGGKVVRLKYRRPCDWKQSLSDVPIKKRTP